MIYSVSTRNFKILEDDTTRIFPNLKHVLNYVRLCEVLNLLDIVLPVNRLNERSWHRTL